MQVRQAFDKRKNSPNAHAPVHPQGPSAHADRRKHISRAKVYLVAIVLVIVFLPSFIKYQELSYKNRQLEERLHALKADNRRLEEEKMRLETDITYVEKRAREEIGVVRKGEIVLKEDAKKKRN
jgi:cell division protein FtsB